MVTKEQITTMQNQPDALPLAWKNARSGVGVARAGFEGAKRPMIERVARTVYLSNPVARRVAQILARLELVDLSIPSQKES